jgi:acetyl esterase/lipase
MNAWPQNPGILMSALIAPLRPEPLTRFLRELGPRYAGDIRAGSDATKNAYLPYLAAAPKGDLSVTRNLAYGSHARQVLDVYVPRSAREAPVVVFVHGGAFVRGDREVNAEIYANVLTWFARHGCVGVNVEYRLAPEAPWPEGGRDVADACAWVRESIGGYGGDPRRVCLVGHSAGGTHAATYAFDPALGLYGRDISALVLMSARVHADARPENPNAAAVRAYFGADEALYAQRSPLTHAAASKLPVMIACAQYENPLLDLYSLDLARCLAQARGSAPRFVMAADHNHMSLMAHFNSGETWLGEQILDFFAATFDH